MNPKISVLVPIYNVSAYIERCAISLFNQTYENIEFVFVNDCTPDNSIELLEGVIDKYPNRKKQIKILHHSINRGLGGSRITLLEAATGDYIMWVDSDDFVTEEAISDLYQGVIDCKVDVVMSDCYYLYRGKDSISIFKQELPSDPELYINALATRKSRASVWNTLSKRSFWVDHQLHMGDKFDIGEDYYSTVCLLYFVKSIAIIHKPIYYYNLTNVNAYTSGRKTEKYIKSIINLFISLEEFFVQQNDYIRYENFLAKAKMVELSSFLLHSSSSLRREYVNQYEKEAEIVDFRSLPYNNLQKFILGLIYTKKFILADFVIILAKISRTLFNVSF